MPIEILMPALSPTMSEGRLAKWNVSVGDSVKPGDVVAEIETDKATMEVEAVDEGVVGSLLVAEGTDGVLVNTPIAVLLSGDEKNAGPASAPPLSRQEDVRDLDIREMRSTSGGSDARIGSGLASSPVCVSSNSGCDGHVVSQRNGGTMDLPHGEMVNMTVREALRSAIAEEMRRDDEVFVIGEEVGEYQGAYKITEGLLGEFGPRRVIDTPITELGFTGLAIGASMVGLKPIVEFMTFNFSMQAIDQIINSAAKSSYMSGGQISCPIVFRGPNGPAAQVAAQHSQDYSAWYSHVPGLKVIHPYSAADAKGLLKAAIRDPNPVIFLENEVLYGRSFPVPSVEDWVVPIGKALVVRSGQDATLVSWGIGMSYALDAAEHLSRIGIDVEVIDLRTLRPMDSETVVRSVMKTGRLVCVEEGWPQCSMSSEVCVRVLEEAFDYLDAPPVRVNGKDVPMPYAVNLENLARPTVEEVVAAVRAVSYR